MPKQDHTSRKASEQKMYDKLRSNGFPKDFAKKRAQQGSVHAHRTQDRKHGDNLRKK